MAPPDIFISYAREDEAWVRPLAAELERCGWSVFWDRRIPAGQTWRSHIGRALKTARCVVVVWSAHSVESEWVLEEADLGKRRRVLVPILKEAVEPPMGFGQIQAADLSAWSPGLPSEMFARFLDDLAGILRSPPQAGLSGAEPLQNTTPVEVSVPDVQGASTQEPSPLAQASPPAAKASPNLETSERDEGPFNASPLESASPSANGTLTPWFEQVETGTASLTSTELPSARHSAPQITAFDQLARPKADATSSSVQSGGIARRLAVLALTTVGVVGGGVYVFIQLSPESTPARVDAKPVAITPRPPQPSKTFTDTLADGTPCPFCPEMVVIPAGSFTMGSPPTEANRKTDEGPQRTVTFAQPFALGRYEVTFAQWDACVTAGSCNGYRPVDQGWGRGSRPVINVSWQDIQSFVIWLSDKTNQPYRLPTEAEWEYGARAGTASPFWTGATISTAQANYDGNYVYGAGVKGIYREQTVAVNDPAFRANPFGLYHVHGNAWEWVQDCYRSDYDGAPIDGSKVVESLDCPERVLRGGSWNIYPSNLRSANRNVSAPGVRFSVVGFRVARAMSE